MSSPPSLGPENQTRTRTPRSREESFRRWLAVLIALVTLLVGITTYLQSDASGLAATLNRRAQENELASTGVRSRGQVELAFAEFVVAREYDEMYGTRVRLSENNEAVAAGGYITASREVTALTPALGPNYTTTREDGLRTTMFTQFEADTWVVTATLLSERRAAAAAEGNAWDNKANNYVAAIATLAVSLFLFGLASTFSGFMRWMFLLVGAGISGLALLGVLSTWADPVHQIPDAALQRYANAYGLEWRGKYPEAINLYSEALKLDPQYANAYARRGINASYLVPPKVQDAIRDLEKARELGAEKYNVYWDLGWEYYISGDYSKSVPLSKKSLELNPKVCGPAFNVALAQLAAGKLAESDKSYQEAISLCEKIYTGARQAGASAPSSLWRDMRESAFDLENLLCKTIQKYCYAGRDVPDVKNVVKGDALVAQAEKYRKRIKEAVTALEFGETTTVRASGATFTPLEFATKLSDADGKFKAYDKRTTFADRDGAIFAVWDYAAMRKGMKLVWKVYIDGVEKADLRYEEEWTLGAEGNAEKKINSWFLLSSGLYDIEVYGDGELLSNGSFVIK